MAIWWNKVQAVFPINVSQDDESVTTLILNLWSVSYDLILNVSVLQVQNEGDELASNILLARLTLAEKRLEIPNPYWRMLDSHVSQEGSHSPLVTHKN